MKYKASALLPPMVVYFDHELVQVLALVDHEVLLRYLVRYHVEIVGARDHFVAGHEVEHGAVKLRYPSFPVELVEVYLQIGGHCQELLPFRVEDLALVLE